MKNGIYDGEYKPFKANTSYFYENGIRQNYDWTNDTVYPPLYRITTNDSMKQDLFFGKYGNSTKSFYDFIGNNLVYPMIAQQKDIDGIVTVQFVVSTTGEINTIKIISDSIGFGLEESAINVIKGSSKFWVPPVMEGMPVGQLFRQAIRFAIW